MKRTTDRGPLHTFKWPLVLTVVTVAALILGLLGTGWVDWLAVALLSVPSVLCCLIWGGRRP